MPPTMPIGTIATTSPVDGGNPSPCAANLNSPAPAGGTVVNLSSNNSAVTVPSSVTVPAGQTTQSFTATTSQVSADVSVTISGTSSAGTISPGDVQVKSLADPGEG